MRIAVNAGPSVGAGVTRVPYFVRVLDASGAVVQGQEFTADFKLTPPVRAAPSQEELRSACRSTRSAISAAIASPSA